MDYSHYQNDFFEELAYGTKSILLNANAGTGKTTTIVEGTCRVDTDNKSVCFVAFNKPIAVHLQTLLPSNIPAATLNAKGFKPIMRSNPATILNANKCRDIYRQFMMNRELESATCRLVSLGKTVGLMNPDFQFLASKYEINCDFDQLPEVIYNAEKVFQISLKQRNVVDFDDQVLFPALGFVSMWRDDVIFVDERQDLNQSQIALLFKALKPGGRIIAVGDMHQAIYAFRGAGLEDGDQLRNVLHAVEMPLSICYRCGTKIVELAQKIVPQIEPWEKAKPGAIFNMQDKDLVKTVKSDDLILCRTNAPLVSTAMKLIASGIKASVRGRDIGKSLVVLINKIQRRYYVDTAAEFMRSLIDYGHNEIAKLIAADSMSKAASLQDQIDTIIAVSNGCYSIPELVQRIESIFSDDIEGVTCSSIHRAKGTEANRVFIIRPDLLPHPMARTPLAREQERNLEYVAITRAKDKLHFVNGGAK